jgi:hypothetical protein
MCWVSHVHPLIIQQTWIQWTTRGGKVVLMLSDWHTGMSRIRVWTHNINLVTVTAIEVRSQSTNRLSLVCLACIRWVFIAWVASS